MARRHATVLAVLPALTLLAACASTGPDAEPEGYGAPLKRGATLAHDEDYGAAIRALNLALEREPELPEALIWRGWARFSEGDDLRAMEDGLRAVELDPDVADHAAAWLSSDADTEMVATARVESAANYLAAFIRQCRALRNVQQVTDDYETSPRAILHRLRGLEAYQNGDDPLAIAEFNRALEIEPSYLDARRGRGHALIASGNYAEALDDFAAVLRERPDDRYALLGGAIAAAECGNVDDSRDWFGRARALWPVDDVDAVDSARRLYFPDVTPQPDGPPEGGENEGSAEEPGGG